jgi:hypothetical protein
VLPEGLKFIKEQIKAFAEENAYTDPENEAKPK